MTDNDLITEVRESFTGVHSATGVDRIQSRARTLRARRRAAGLAGALAVGAAAVAAVTALGPAGHQPSHSGGIRLAAWTVTKQADGTIDVTIRQLRDPAGLQRTLRADGLPATVTFFGQLPSSCQRFPATNLDLINRVFSSRQAGRYTVMVIHPSALPAGAGVQINPPDHQWITSVAIGLVQASPQCTGS
jgi:hypothetical protein